MFKRALTICSGLIIATFGVGASAQLAPNAADDGFDAEIISVDEANREITVRLEANGEVMTYDVAQDAEFYVWDGVMERPRSFSDLTNGHEVMLEFDGVEGQTTLKKITTDESGQS